MQVAPFLIAQGLKLLVMLDKPFHRICGIQVRFQPALL
jgi:hypothetical protein